MARRTGIGSQKDITFGIICLFFTLSACGGGSGGGAGSVTSLAVTQPHQVQARQWEVQIVIPWGQVPRLSSVMALRHITSRSRNSLQDFTGQSVHFGFQWR